MSQERVLVVDDEQDLAESCAFFLEREGFEVAVATSGESALEILAREPCALVVTDVRMPRMSGMDLLTAVKAKDPDIEVLIVTGYPELEMAVAAIKQGAFDYLAKPYGQKELMERVAKAIAHRRMKDRNEGLRERLRGGVESRRLLHRSAEFGAAVEMLERAARTDASVLLIGESGTGKELLAHHLHDVSARADKPFVPVDCTAIPTELFESELFGHSKGAFTGATSAKLGLFQVADGGTIFFDEVGELPTAFQPKLLRAIQERSVRPVGSRELVGVDVRIVAATNRDLQRDVDEGRFRADLFYRIDVVRIPVPPLRERAADIEGLVDSFVDRFGGHLGFTGVTAAAGELLRGYRWPGNVRQLRNAIERACALGHPPLLEPADLPPELRGAEERMPLGADADAGTFQEMKARRIAAMERSYIASLLQRHRGNVTHSSEAAGMARSAFQKLMQKYGIKSSDFRG